MTRASGTQGYAEEAEFLLRQYEGIAFEAVQGWLLPLLPPAPARVLEIGAGTGRDAAGYAALGHAVLAVEPTAELREKAVALHPAPGIAWLDDSLPDLARVGGTFDVVALTAVWMHLDEEERRRGMPRLAALLRPGGIAALTLRHGPVPPGRRMFDVSGEETARLGAEAGLVAEVLTTGNVGALRRPGVSWTRVLLRKAGR